MLKNNIAMGFGFFVVGSLLMTGCKDSGCWTRMNTRLTKSIDFYETWELSAIWGNYAVGWVILHSDGNTWTEMEVDSANVPLYLDAVWGSSDNDVLAVGNNPEGGRILHYDGIGWSIMDSSEPSLSGVWGTTSSNVYAVGSGGEGGLILHYDGVQWSVEYSSSISGFTAIWGSSSSDVFVAGCKTGAAQQPDTEILHFDGDQWSSMPLGLDPGTGCLRSIWGTSSTDVFALGVSGMVLHYDGLSWSSTREPGVDPASNYLAGIWGSSGDNVLMVDWYSSL